MFGGWTAALIVKAAQSDPRANGACSSLSMPLYFLASADELADIGDDWILNEATGTRTEMSQVGSRLNIWSRGGKLLATSEQLCWFK